MTKRRLDELLVERKLSRDLKEASAMILSGAVLVGGQRVDKPGTSIDAASEVRLRSPARKYVSRGGLKLEVALHRFGVSVRGKICLDLGASTGGFTDCLLQHGAARVYAFDVGRGQLDWTLRQHPAVRVREAVNIRHLEASMVQDRVDLITVDVSFISLRLVLPPLQQFPGADVLVLVKPQFEARREEVGRGGLIRDPALRQAILERVKESALQQGLALRGEMPSPVRGQKGNQEYFLYLKIKAQPGR